MNQNNTRADCASFCDLPHGKSDRSGSSARNVRTTRETERRLPDSDRIVKVLGPRHYGFFATYENPRLIKSLTCETYIATMIMKSLRILELNKLNIDSYKLQEIV